MLTLEIVYGNFAVVIEDFDPPKQFFAFFSKAQYIWNNLQLRECKKSARFKGYGCLKFGCCIIARHHRKMRLKNMLKICLVFCKSEPRYAYKRYAYKKKHV